MANFETYYNEVRELSNYDLNRLIENNETLPKEKFRAILSELEKRGALDEIGKNQLARITSGSRNILETGSKIRETPRTPLSDPNIVNDPEAPILYSRYALRFFSVIFSPFFAGILLAINLYRLQKKNRIVLVILISFIYSYFTLILAGKFPEKMMIILLALNLLGSFVLEELFWNRYIGRDFKFRRQYIMPALAIGFGISILYMLIVTAAS